MLVHVLEISVYMIPVPVEGIVLRAQIVPREVSGWIAQVVILIPQNTLTEEYEG